MSRFETRLRLTTRTRILVPRPAPSLLRAAGLAALAIGAAGRSGAAAQAPHPSRLQPSAIAQMKVLEQEQLARTTAQRKIDSRLLFALYRLRGDSRLKALPRLRIVVPDSDGKMLLDVDALARTGMKSIIRQLQATGAEIRMISFRYLSLRARVPLAQIEALAALPEVRRVDLARRARTQADVNEGDATHRAAEARSFFGISGAGVKICALSNGVSSLAQLQANGDLPPSVDVLPGQAGSGDEGTAMLEILHDLAPGAQLGFATAINGEASFAQNILDLRNVLHCDIIVDDVAYFRESPFQDLDVAQSVNSVTAAGALYFSSAGNDGNLDAGTSGTWQGDFKANGNLDPVLGTGAGTTHDFGDAGQSDLVTRSSQQAVTLHWADPFNTACDDYNLYLLDTALTSVMDQSTNIQDCSPGSDPFEATGAASTGERVVVTKTSGADVMIFVQAPRGTLQLATAGCAHGHNSAANAFAVAAAPAAGADQPGDPSGPYPGPFTGAQLAETFTCDGPRRIFFDNAGNLLPGAPAGNFSSSGGVVRQKPDITAADGVSSDTAGFNPFFGTSAAVAHAAAIAGLLKSALPGLAPAQIRGALVGSAIDIQAPGVDRDTGAGIVMAFQALQAAGAAPMAALNLGTVTPTQAVGNGDAFIDPGELWNLAIALTNVGGAPATGVSATLATSTPGVFIFQPTSGYPGIAAGGGSATNTTPFQFTPNAASCGTVIQFTLTVSLFGGSSPQTFNFSLQTGHPGTPVTTSYAGKPVPIPDAVFNTDGSVTPGSVTVPLAVSGVPGLIAKAAFSFDGTLCTTAPGATTVGVDHTFISDLTFVLQSPGGTQITLVNQTDSSGHNFCRVLLDDDGAGPSIQCAADTQAPFTGNWTPANPLVAFKGENANGTWQLIATDNSPQDTGSVRAFSLVITPAACAPAQAGFLAAVPTLSDAGLAVLALALLACGAVVLRWRRWEET
ncbi:MAG TPA: proprotein convertase P-domain-containing protein [Thermoanaerobaculia bacterium]|nr:proprotein convertase P-domain-containing protein [Thermoanaerobaculia bacterium]